MSHLPGTPFDLRATYVYIKDVNNVILLVVCVVKLCVPFCIADIQFSLPLLVVAIQQMIIHSLSVTLSGLVVVCVPS